VFPELWHQKSVILSCHKANELGEFFLEVTHKKGQPELAAPEQYFRMY